MIEIIFDDYSDFSGYPIFLIQNDHDTWSLEFAYSNWELDSNLTRVYNLVGNEKDSFPRLHDYVSGWDDDSQKQGQRLLDQNKIR